jgi:hypothetical protein
MNFGTDARPLGRYVIDIDGSLRTTDAARVSPADIIALHGAVRLGSALTWERNGEIIVLSTGDRIELDESTVFFFRTAPKRRLHRRERVDFHPAYSHRRQGEHGLNVAA